MVKSTETAIRAIARADSTITEAQIKAGLDAFAGKSALVDRKPAPMESLYTREDVAELLHKSPKAVDVLCRRGVLVRVYPTFPDGTRATRAAGITERSVRAFVTGGDAVATAADAKAVAVC